MKEMGVGRDEFMDAVGFTTNSSFSSYLAGFSKLNLWQVPLVAEKLQLDERTVLLMCLAQDNNDWCMHMFRRHIST